MFVIVLCLLILVWYP